MQLLDIVIYTVGAMLHFVFQLFGIVRLTECIQQCIYNVSLLFDVMPDDEMECLEGETEMRGSSYNIFISMHGLSSLRKRHSYPCVATSKTHRKSMNLIYANKSTRDSNVHFF